MQTCRRWLFCLMFMLGTIAIPNLISAESQANPYIYYYSFEQQAFVIETSDGSENTTLAAYRLPEGHNLIEGPGWSTSGRWFAWTSATEYRPFRDQKVYVVDKESKIVHTIFSNTVQITNMSWSPTSDLLLVGFYEEKPPEQVIVYDPATDKILQTFAAGAPSSEEYFLRMYWSADGVQVFLVKPGSPADVIVLPIKEEAQIIQARTDDADLCNDFGNTVHVLKDGRIAHLHPNNSALVIEDISASIQESIELPAGRIGSIDWTSNDEYALVYINPYETEYKYDLWLLSLVSKTTEQISTDVYFGECYTPFDSSTWSFRDQGAFIASDGNLWFLTTSPRKSVKISPDIDGQVLPSSPLRWTEEGNLVFIWENSATYNTAIYIYNPSVDKTEALTPTDLKTHITYFAPMWGDYLAYTESGNVVILNNKDNTQNRIDFEAALEYGSIGATEIIWHPTQSWLFMLSENIETEHLVNVVNSDGSLQRQLTICPLDAPSCFGWMP